MIQTLENDMRCDGTDAENFAAFGATFDEALTQIETDLPGARTFVVSVWDDVRGWAEWGLDVPGQPDAYAGDGPCDVYDESGQLRPDGIASMQQISDGYWAEIEKACAAHAGCATDGKAETREFETTDADVALDHNHLSIAGHAKFAAIAWDALPQDIKDAR